MQSVTNRRRWWGRGVALSVALATVASATLAQVDGDGATTRPRFGGGGGDGRFGSGGQRGGWRGEPPTGEEWDAIDAFMKINGPVRLEMLKRVEDGLGSERPIAVGAKRRIVARYRDLLSMQSRSPSIYPLALKRLQLEDVVMRTMRDLRAPGADKDALNRRLTDQVRASIDNTLAERRARIEQAKAAIERETKSLADDEANPDALVPAQLKKFQSEMDPMLDFDQQNTPATTQAS